MADLNNWSITGRLTADAEYKTLASGKNLLVMNVAVNSGFGEYAKTTFVKVQQWGDRGGKIVDYLRKGTLIACSGELITNEWNTREGEKRVDLQLTTNSLQFYNTKKADTSDSIPTGTADNGDGTVF